MDTHDPRYTAVQALTGYWLRHPHASDSLEGICRWWLNISPMPAPLVEQALAWLTQRGVVVAQHAADGRVRYRLVDPGPPESN
jgi:hypothetical protein